VRDGKSRCFEILGFDIIVDSTGCPWLLEVNSMPSLRGCSEFDKNLKCRVITDTLKIIDLKPSFRTQEIERFKKMSALGISAIEPNFDPEIESEIARSTNWRQLLPVIDDKPMEELCNRALQVSHGFQRRPTTINETPRLPKAPPPPKTEQRPRLVPQKTIPNIKSRIVIHPVIPRVAVQSQPVAMTCRPGNFNIGNETRYVMRKNWDLGEGTPWFVVWESRNVCAIVDSEERERVREMNKRMQMTSGISMGFAIRKVFRDGRFPVFEEMPKNAIFPFLPNRV
jgi:hypothetical protein